METAEELKGEFNKHQINLNISENGGKCDVYTFRNVVRECVNISDGVFGEHTYDEYIDLDYFYKMVTSLKNIDFEKISINRVIVENVERINYKKLKDVLAVRPNLNLKVFKIQNNSKESDYIDCYFKVNNQDDYKAVFYKDLSIKFARIVKINYVKKLEYDPKLKDVSHRKIEPEALSDNDKKAILEKIQEYISGKLQNI